MMNIINLHKEKEFKIKRGGVYKRMEKESKNLEVICDKEECAFKGKYGICYHSTYQKCFIHKNYKRIHDTIKKYKTEVNN